MPSPFPGMDPYLETGPVFHELHTQLLATAQARLQSQLRPKYIAKLERYLSEGSVWNLDVESLEGKEPDIAIVRGNSGPSWENSTAVLTAPTTTLVEQLDPEELSLRRQRRIVIYVQSRPRQAIASIELLSPSNKQRGSLTQARYLEKRASALHGGLHWIEIDLLRGGERPPIPLTIPAHTDYLTYIAQATTTGWRHSLFVWELSDALPNLPIPLLGDDRAVLPLGDCFQEAFDRIAADEEVDYSEPPPAPPLSQARLTWIDRLLRSRGLR